MYSTGKVLFGPISGANSYSEMIGGQVTDDKIERIEDR